jgi:hypothetical protein
MENRGFFYWSDLGNDVDFRLNFYTVFIEDGGLYIF